MWILLFSEVTLFEYVTTILSMIAALKLKLAVNRFLDHLVVSVMKR